MRNEHLIGCGMALLTAGALLGACSDQAGSADGVGGELAGGAADGGSTAMTTGGDSQGGGCAELETPCDGECVDLSSDPNNCGQCGTSCSVKHASGSCSASACAIDTCDDGFVDCNGETADGCEAKDEGLPDAPRLLSPPIGQNTGSALTDSARMPELRW